MSELHKFIFDGLPVRGVLVRLTDAWTEILSRRASNTTSGAYAPEVRDMLGEMTAAAALISPVGGFAARATSVPAWVPATCSTIRRSSGCMPRWAFSSSPG